MGFVCRAVNEAFLGKVGHHFANGIFVQVVATLTQMILALVDAHALVLLAVFKRFKQHRFGRSIVIHVRLHANILMSRCALSVTLKVTR